jgi:hypothetical protein
MRAGTSCILPWSGGADAPVSIAVPIVSTVAVSTISVPVAIPAIPAIPVAVPASGASARASSPGNGASVSRGQTVVAAAEGTADVGAHSLQDRGDADAEQPQQQGVLDQALAAAVPKQGAPTRGHEGSE